MNKYLEKIARDNSGATEAPIKSFTANATRPKGPGAPQDATIKRMIPSPAKTSTSIVAGSAGAKQVPRSGLMGAIKGLITRNPKTALGLGVAGAIGIGSAMGSRNNQNNQGY